MHIRSGQVPDIFGKHLNAKGMMPIVLDMRASQGVTLVDGLTGKSYIDFFGFFASNMLGMNHPKLESDEAALKRLKDAALNKVSNSDVQTAHMARFLETFSRVAQPSTLPYAFFISGGALAVENTLKAAFDWKVRKNLAKGISSEHGQDVMHLREAFHGRSGYTLSLTNTSEPWKTRYFPKFNWPRILNPKITFPLADHLEHVVSLEAQALDEAKSYFFERKNEIACIILEPIQGEGGDNHFRPEFLRALKELCLENDALLILDEVQCGAGITGTFWAWEQLGVTPDLIAFGKKTQVCGVLAGHRLDEVEEHVFVKSGRINSTWGGNLVDMVRFDRIMEIMEEDALLLNTRTVGNHLLGRLEKIADSNDHLSNARGRGLMCAIDVSTRTLRDELLKLCRESGLLVIGCGQSTIRFRPPLIITQIELDFGMDIMERVVRAGCTAQTKTFPNDSGILSPK
ncbi:MAG: L-lysine 6-transaminase [Bacteroidota bacterium]|nr:L-lysine 6-transaminase [Bacteroidota bacterium]